MAVIDASSNINPIVNTEGEYNLSINSVSYVNPEFIIEPHFSLSMKESSDSISSVDVIPHITRVTLMNVNPMSSLVDVNASYKRIISFNNTDMVGTVNVSSSIKEIVHGLLINIEPSTGVNPEFYMRYSIKPNIQSTVDVINEFYMRYSIKPSIEGSSSIDVLDYTVGQAIRAIIETQAEWIDPEFEVIPLVPYKEYYAYIKSLLPERYREDDDFLVFVNSIARELGRLREFASKIPVNKDPYLAPKQFLSLIAKMIGYNRYRYDLDVEDNRKILSRYIDILRRKATPRLLKAAVRFEGHPEDLLYKYEDYGDVFINFPYTGIYTIIYEGSELSPSIDDISHIKQAGVKALFAFAPIIVKLDLSIKEKFNMQLRFTFKINRETEDVKLAMIKRLPSYTLRQPHIWGSPAYELGEVTDTAIEDRTIQQPDFEVVQFTT